MNSPTDNQKAPPTYEGIRTTNLKTGPSKTGILLVNLGTPLSTDLPDIKNYLREFLSDPFVIDLPTPLRWILVNGIILKVRPRKTQHAYKSIWTEEGSPLLVLSRRFEAAFSAVARAAKFEGPIELAMRYSSPSLKEGLQKLKKGGATEVIAVPLYPQYALSSTETVVQKLKELAPEFELPLTFVPAFYKDPEFIRALVESVHASGALKRCDHLVMSFHGLPERHVKKTDGCGGRHCLSKPDCCEVIDSKNENCYRAQSVQTARLLAQELGLKSDQWSLGFQSRLTRKWIQPFTDKIIEELPSRGIRKVAVICPSFVTDCLETLEEIGMRAKEDFVSRGGEHLELIPCLNDQKSWAEACWSLTQRALKKAF